MTLAIPFLSFFKKVKDQAMAKKERPVVALKPVTVKSYESNNVVITGGVDEGSKVVVLGVQKLDPAQKVRVVSSLSF